MSQVRWHIVRKQNFISELRRRFRKSTSLTNSRSQETTATVLFTSGKILDWGSSVRFSLVFSPTQGRADWRVEVERCRTTGGANRFEERSMPANRKCRVVLRPSKLDQHKKLRFNPPLMVKETGEQKRVERRRMLWSNGKVKLTSLKDCF